MILPPRSAAKTGRMEQSQWARCPRPSDGGTRPWGPGSFRIEPAATWAPDREATTGQDDPDGMVGGPTTTSRPVDRVTSDDPMSCDTIC